MRRSQPRLLSLISLISATALIACSGSDVVDTGTLPRDGGTTPADAGDDPADSGVTDSGDTPSDSGVEDAGPMTCLVEEAVDTTPDPSCNGEWVATVRGVLTTDDGEPLNDGRAQVCVRSPTDNLVCLRPEASCPDGVWEVLVPDGNIRCVDTMVMHSFAFEGSYADTYCSFDVVGQGPRMALPNPVVIYRTTPAVGLPPLGDETAARTVDLVGNLEVDVTPMQLFEGYERMAAVRLAGDASPAPCFVGPNDDFDAMWGFTPSINIRGADGFPFRITDTGLTQGTMVDLYVLGGLECWLGAAPETVVEEGHWDNYATVTVGANGNIEGNLPCFNWFAYKAR